MTELKIRTNVYTGPLDLLLYLCRQSEVDIYDLPVADIADQYIAELEKMDRVDLEFAGEYLVQAARLLKLKSEMVLHLAQTEGASDPRESFVQQLLEYKRYRDLSLALGEHLADEARRHGRPSGLLPDLDAEDIYLDDVAPSGLYREYARLMREVTPSSPHRVLIDDRPIAEYIADILVMLEHGQAIDFAALFAPRVSRQAVIGNFLAILELVKQRKVDVEQDDDGQIRVLPPSEHDESGNDDEATDRVVADMRSAKSERLKKLRKHQG